MSKNQNAHDIHDQNLPDTFQKFQHVVDHPLEAANGRNSVPNFGWVKHVQETTERGRAQIKAAEAACRGISNFPPVRLLGKGHKP